MSDLSFTRMTSYFFNFFNPPVDFIIVLISAEGTKTFWSTIRDVKFRDPFVFCNIEFIVNCKNSRFVSTF